MTEYTIEGLEEMLKDIRDRRTMLFCFNDIIHQLIDTMRALDESKKIEAGLVTTVEELRAERDALRAMLKTHEHSGCYVNREQPYEHGCAIRGVDDVEFNVCPECLTNFPRHAPDCELNKLIKE